MTREAIVGMGAFKPGHERKVGRKRTERIQVEVITGGGHSDVS